MPATDPELRAALRELYSDVSFVPRAWTDIGDPQFLGIHLIERSIARLATELTGELLDVGCGRQPYANQFTHVGRKRACDWNSARGQVDFTCPADAIPLPAGSLDSILCTEVLEHVPHPHNVWREFGRVLKPGGKVLLTTPMYWPSHEEPYDFFRYTGFGLDRLARDAGFDVLKLYPRGGVWAFLGQVVQHAMPQYLRFRWQRAIVNRVFLFLDRWRCNPQLTLGWTILAVRRANV